MNLDSSRQVFLGEASDPESCFLTFGIAFRSTADKPTIAGVFEFADQDCDIFKMGSRMSHSSSIRSLGYLMAAD